MEGQVTALEALIRRLAQADSLGREEILAQLPLTSNTTVKPATVEGTDESPSDPTVVAARLRAGQLRRQHPTQGTQFFGGTSVFQIHLAGEASSASVAPGLVDPTGNFTEIVADPATGEESHHDFDDLTPRSGSFQYAPHDEVSQRLMAAFFREQYQFIMVVYREYFLRDYDIGSGKYYSDLLLYAICALGARQHDDTAYLSEIFSGQAQALLYATLDKPDLTTLQALVLLGYHEIALGRSSKGWLFCGMAVRLAHEMGLHLDPNNWDGEDGFSRDREILRRVYWAVFIADKQLSLFFGRPPALYPGESDVRNTIRLQYPSDWQGLLEQYVGTTLPASEFEDGVALVGSFIYRAELCKVVHTMITDLFENRRNAADPAIVATKSRQVHVSLTKWLASLPGTLHWNQWTVGKVQPSVLHLHMVFHTVMIILHRPPTNMFNTPGVAESEDVEICYESLQAILRLMRSFSRFYRYRSLPLDFVYTLATAAGVVMMKRSLQKSSWTDPDIERSLSLILEAMNEIQTTWPCVKEVRNVLLQVQNTQPNMAPEDVMSAPDLMTGLHLDPTTFGDFMTGISADDINTLITDEYLSTQLHMPETGLDTFDFNSMPGPSG